MEEQQEWLKRLQKSIEATRDWEKRIAVPEKVQQGSSLAKDDDGLAGDPVRSAAWYGIVTAVDHLALGADLTRGELNLRPTSLFTVTRAALLGASQAVWVLTGSREDRRLRALAVAADERRQHRKFMQDYAKDKYVRENFSPEFVANLDALSDRLHADLERLDPIRKGKSYSGAFDSTKMMQEAAEHLAGKDTPDSHWLRMALSYEWRIASAGAHARAWPFFVRKTERTSLEGGGEVRRMTSSISEFVQSYGAATLMTSEAWRLWDLRRAQHF